ncbi:MAG TPA: CehA/McbA family metallohydrolase [Gemmataceae bacterium]|nr:CehA/McbA family metallohydrolase [Gemmataceae bacterium]
MSGQLQTVHVRVNDAATGQPTPVRIRFTDAAGTYYAPFGRLPRLGLFWGHRYAGNLLLDGKEFAYIDGTCEINLPPGQITVEVHKGPEYTPLRQEISLSPGKLALRLTMERWTNLRDEGWYSGDVGPHHLEPFGALLEAAGEDLAVVNLLAQEREVHDDEHGGGVFVAPAANLAAFSGQRPALERPGHLVAVNTLNWHPVLGNLVLLSCHRVVYPLRFGASPGLPEYRDNWTMADWCDQCHRKAGLVAWTAMQSWRFGESRCGEPLADLILGKVDAVRPSLARVGDWYALLNCGFRLPLLGGSVREFVTTPLGAVRTYVRLQAGQEFGYKAWIEAVRAGRTFLTEGPLLRLTANDQEPGSVHTFPGLASLKVRAEARSLIPFDRLELLVGGMVVASTTPTGTPTTASLDEEVTFGESGWLAARCWRDDPKLPRATAQTSPVYVTIAGEPIRRDLGTVNALLGHLDRMVRWVAEEAQCDTEEARARLAGIFQNARQVLLPGT